MWEQFLGGSMKTIEVSEQYVTEATLALLEKEVREHILKDKSPFTMKKLLGTNWDIQYVPFYEMFNHLPEQRQSMTAGQQMGRLFKKVCDRLNLKNREVGDGKGHKHTEYFLPE